MDHVFQNVPMDVNMENVLLLKSALAVRVSFYKILFALQFVKGKLFKKRNPKRIIWFISPYIWLIRGCINGICTAPNRCSCRDGYTIDKSGTRCDVKCDRPCFNGNSFIYTAILYHLETNLCESLSWHKKLPNTFQQVIVVVQMYVNATKATI